MAESPPPGASDPAEKTADRVVIKKYANRRLYNTSSSSYVTLDHLAAMVKDGVDFVVYDAKTNEDITRQVLTQIIFEAENRGESLLPIQFLRQLIRMYGDQMQSFVPSYLEMSLDAFTRQQGRLREQMAGAFGTQGYNLFEEQVRQNMALFDRAMRMFTPFAYARAEETAPPSPPPQPQKASEPAIAGIGAERDETLAELKRRMEEMQRQIERLATKK